MTEALRALAWIRISWPILFFGCATTQFAEDKLILQHSAEHGHVSWWTVEIPRETTAVSGTMQMLEPSFGAKWIPTLGVFFHDGEIASGFLRLDTSINASKDQFATVSLLCSDPQHDQGLAQTLFRHPNKQKVRWKVEWIEARFLVTVGTRDAIEIECPIDPSHLDLSVSSGRGRIEVDRES